MTEFARGSGVMLAIVIAIAPFSASAGDGVRLRVDKTALAGEVRLSWTHTSNASAPFSVYRSISPVQIAAPGNLIGQTSGTSWQEIPPAAPLTFYLVTGVCQPSSESCDDVDNDCNGVTDDGCPACTTSSQCTAFDRPSVCNDSTQCQGTAQRGVCGESRRCYGAIIDDDSGCNGQKASTCGFYPSVACTSQPDQPGAPPCATSCLNDQGCDPNAHCTPAGACAEDLSNGNSCTRSAQCTSGACVDGVCCNSACTGTCVACNLTGSVGTCSSIPTGQDPGAECPGLSCVGYYHSWLGDSCRRKADVPAAQASCDGAGACRTIAQECTAQSAVGPVTITCDSLCQDPNLSTCSGTIAGGCTNVNPGDQTCGVGACERTVPRCSFGAPVTCHPGSPTTETCNDIDDNCDGTVDNCDCDDGFESNNSCATQRILATVGEDQENTITSATIYPSADTDHFLTRGSETSGTCECCDGFPCFDEDHRMVFTLTVPAGAGSYQLCAAAGACSTFTNCIEVSAGTSGQLVVKIDGDCPSSSSYDFPVRVRGLDLPAFECRPYTLKYRFEQGCY